jgi:hypothetical protein
MSEHTAIAKVMLLGDSGVGKSALASVLSRQTYQPTEPTCSGKVVTLALGEQPTRQAAVWDLDGRPGCRTVQQLHLDAIAAALIVFDARAAEPFDGVLFWTRALARARQREGDNALPMKAYLVAARTDSGQVDEKDMHKRLRDSGLVGIFGTNAMYLTSAKKGWEIAKLRQAIHAGIEWDALPASSGALIDAMEQFLSEERQQGRLIARVDDLLHSYRRARTQDNDIRATFTACIGLAENRGLIRLMRRSDLVVLQPELVDDYARALLRAAKEEPDGFGVLAKHDVLGGSVAPDEQPGLLSRAEERQLLEAIVAELDWRELVAQQNTEQGVYLAFPPQLAGRTSDSQVPPGSAVKFLFGGEPTRVFATLAARLMHSPLFEPTRTEPSSVLGTVKAASGECGIHLRALRDDCGELVISYGKDAPALARVQFEEIITGHLRERAAVDTVIRLPILSCPNCGFVVTDDLIKRKLDRGATTVRCQDCGGYEISLTGPSANEADNFDVFLSYNSKDVEQVKEIRDQLIERGFRPWMDKYEMVAGVFTQPQLQHQINSGKPLVFFIGPHGLGDWQELEVGLATILMVKKKYRLIPVFLTTYEGKVDNFDTLSFADLLHVVDMRESDPDPFEKLVRAIQSVRVPGIPGT